LNVQCVKLNFLELLKDMSFNCDRCNKEVDRRKFLKKVNKENLCSECYIENRNNHRKETIEVAGIKEDLRELTNKMSRERDYSKKAYEKKIGHKPRSWTRRNKENDYIPKRYQSKEQESNINDVPKEAPKIKNSNIKKKEKSYAYLVFQERQELLRMLMKGKGLNFNDAKNRINRLEKQQKKIRDLMKEKNKSEEEIKQKQKQMLEELWKN
jgi:hypothetical protein